MAGRTATVKELREFLKKYPDDMPVMATWEGVNAYMDISEGYVEVNRVSKGHDEDACDCLVIWVEDY